MISVWVDGIGVYAPGLASWEQAIAVLTGQAPYTPDALPKLAPPLLPSDVRRRTTEHIRLAVEVGAQAVAHAQADGSALWSVFASSESDGAITHNICEEVARDTPEVSPTRFHNSVNNAPAGYWCMAIQSRAPSTSIAAFDASFTAGLLEACAQVCAERQGVLYVAHDTPLPEPLHSVRPMSAIYGMALVLRPARTAHSLARLTPRIDTRLEMPSRLTDVLSGSGDDVRAVSIAAAAALDGLRTGNPAARGLPLLAALARRVPASLNFPYVHGQTLQVGVEPA